MLNKLFQIKEHESTWRKELMAGLTSFFTCSYIILVNPLILRDAGIPIEAGVISSIIISILGCLLMGLFANAPIILIPGMGINAFFSYTMVQSMGLSPQQGLAVIMVSGLVFAVIAFTSLSTKLISAVPSSLKHGITSGIGVYLTFIGLQKGELIRANPSTLVEVGNLASPVALATIIGLMVTLILFARNVKGSLLIGLLSTACLTIISGTHSALSSEGISIAAYKTIFLSGQFSFITIPFWIATFSITMIVLFENVGLLSGMLPDVSKFPKALRITAISTILSGIVGTSPTVASAESAAGIAEGGKTGIPALVTAILFLACIPLLPYVGYIPENAVAPILILIGALMMRSLAEISFNDFTEWVPAFLMVVCIPLTSSIAEGIAFGFIFYPIMKLAVGKWKDVSVILYVCAALFLCNLFALPLFTH
ncbi:NCS2 family permease [Paenibacillus sp. NPDC058177]|uniref:NCS2 family permease n=1 Tax=Paenibacillus sp. NPDC058177 TaxID=3346369 RepID=UPI0036DC6528